MEMSTIRSRSVRVPRECQRWSKAPQPIDTRSLLPAVSRTKDPAAEEVAPVVNAAVSLRRCVDDRNRVEAGG